MDLSRRRKAIVVVALGVLAGCDDSPESTRATRDPSATAIVAADSRDRVTVEIARSRFGTRELRVATGTTVAFLNTDEFAHTVTSRDGAPVAFDSGELGEGDVFEIAFDEPGEYAYFCRIHPTMRASVIVG